MASRRLRAPGSPNARAVEAAGGRDDATAEGRLDGGHGRPAGAGQFVGDSVGIHHHRAQPGEGVGGGALAAADAAGQADDEAHHGLSHSPASTVSPLNA